MQYYNEYEHEMELDEFRPPVICDECGCESPREDCAWTHDCHGIPFRLLCLKCYEKIMSENGYDGEYYTEADECLDYDF